MSHPFYLINLNIDYTIQGGAEFLTHEDPDVICFQETKVNKEKLPQEMKEIKGYPYCYWLAAKKDGYSGVG